MTLTAEHEAATVPNGRNWKTVLVHGMLRWLTGQPAAIVLLVLIFAAQIVALGMLYRDSRADAAAARADFKAELAAEREDHRGAESENRRALAELVERLGQLTLSIERLVSRVN